MREVLRNMVLNTPDMQFSATDKGLETKVTVTAFENRADIAFNPANQHFYKFVPGKISGTDAFAAVSSQKEFGLTGYMASITSAEENDFVSSKIEGAKNVWIGASDLAAEGTWKWVGGPDDGKQFWKGNCSKVDGSAFEGGFAKWATGEPNNDIYLDSEPEKVNRCGGADYDPTSKELGEDCVVTNWLGYQTPIAESVGHWNDFPCSLTQAWNGTREGIPIGGYVVEFGDKPVGGNFVNIDLVSNTLVPFPPSPKVIAPNFHKKAGTFLDKVAAKLFKPSALLKKQKPKVSKFVTLNMKVKLAEAGTYSLTVKRVNGKGIPFAMQIGTTYKVQGGKKSKPTNIERWNLVINTQKDNQTVTLSPVFARSLLAASNVTTKEIKAYISLIATKKEQENQACLANWCQSANVPTLKK